MDDGFGDHPLLVISRNVSSGILTADIGFGFMFVRDARCELVLTPSDLYVAHDCVMMRPTNVEVVST